MEDAKTTTLKLENPIRDTNGEVVLEELVFEPVTAEAVWDMSPQLGMGELLRLAGKLTGQPESLIRKLSGVDVGRVIEVARSFLAEAGLIEAQPA